MNLRIFIFCCILIVLFTTCKKDKYTKEEDPAQNNNPVLPPPAPDPWQGLVFPKNTPLAIRKEILSWQKTFCVFSKVTEYQYMGQSVYEFDSGCDASDPTSLLMDSSATVQCLLTGTNTPDCMGANFSEATDPRIIWKNFDIHDAQIKSISVINSSLTVGAKTFVGVHSFAASEKFSEFDHYELWTNGLTIMIKTFYRITHKPLNPLAQPKEFFNNIEFVPNMAGKYVFRADSTANIADTLVVH